jgi:hypothetical protein
MENVNSLGRVLGTLLTVKGLKMLQSGFDDFKPTEVSFGIFKTAFNNVGLYGVSTTEMDVKYYSSEWKSLQEAVSVAYSVVKAFPWTPEKFDCDNRSAFMSLMCSLIGFTLGQARGEVYDAKTGELKYLHWFNVAVDTDKNLYVVDADNSGHFVKVEKGKDIIIIDCRYKILSARFF